MVFVEKVREYAIDMEIHGKDICTVYVNKELLGLLGLVIKTTILIYF